MKSIKKNIILNCIRTFISVFFPFIIFQYASRIILAENLGKVNFSNSIVNYFILIAGLGINAYSIRESGKLVKERIKMEIFASEVFSINIVSTFMSLFLLGFFAFFSTKLHGYYALLSIQSLAILSTTISLDWVNVVYEDYVYITVRTLIFQIATFVLAVFFVKSVEDYVVFAAIVVAGKVGPDLLNWFYIRKKYLKVRIAFSIGLKRHLKPIFIIFFNALVISIYVNIDTTMIGFFKGDTQVGYYSVAVKIYTALKTVFSAIISVLIPRMSLYLASKKQEEANRLIGNTLDTFVMVIAPLIIFIYLNSSKIISIVFGIEYSNSILALQILSLGIVFSVFASIITNCIFLPLTMEKYSLIATSTSAITNLVLNFYFIKQWGIYGAAITTVISECVVFFISYILLRRENIKLFSLMYIQHIIETLMISLVVVIVSIVSSHIIDNEILNIFSQVLLILCLYVFVFRNQIITYIRKR